MPILVKDRQSKKTKVVHVPPNVHFRELEKIVIENLQLPLSVVHGVRLVLQGKLLRANHMSNVQLRPHTTLTVEANHLRGGAESKDEKPKIKCVLVGDAGTGKSSLMTSYLFNSFNENYESAVLDPFVGERVFNNRPVDLEIHDTNADETYKDDRKETYKQADVFLICIAANKP